jgi:hypothetical protein
MAAKFHLAEDALALHLFLQHLEGLIDIVVPDKNLHAAFLFDRAIDGSDGQRRPGHWRTEMYHSDAYGTRGTNQRRYLNSCLPMGTTAANWKSEDFGTSPFFEQLFRQVSACLYMPVNGRAVDKEQWESSTVSRSPCGRLVDRTALDRRRS